MNIIGNNLPTDKGCELFTLARTAGVSLTEIHDCKDYDAYQNMAGASVNLCYHPAAKAGGEALEQRLGQRLLYLPLSYDYEAISRTLGEFAAVLGIEPPDWSDAIAECEAAFSHTKEIIGSAPITIDYTATMRPLSLAKVLLTHGLRVTRIYADSFSGEDKADLLWLQAHHPEIEVYATVQVKMRVLPRKTDEKTLAVGQKAAYFTGSPYFVNIVEGGGYYGFSGLRQMLALMEDAFLHEKDTRKLIQIKGLGCGCV